MPGAEHVAPYAAYRCPYGTSTIGESGDACARMIEYVLEREGDIAAFIAEPMRAVPHIPPPGFWRRVREACDRHGTLLIFDEIPTGLGKTGKMFACEHDGVVPDILVLGKALGGGILPIAAVIARPELDVGADWAFGHYTHEKNPVTARAALTTIEIIEEEGLVDNAAKVGAFALARLDEMKMKPSRDRRRARRRPAARHRVGSPRAPHKPPANGAAEAVMYRALESAALSSTPHGEPVAAPPTPHQNGKGGGGPPYRIGESGRGEGKSRAISVSAT